MNAERPLAAFPGTVSLGRPLTDAEKAELSALLRAHDFAGACVLALRFAAKLARSQQGAQDLMGRVVVRLLRRGWDPQEVPLVKRLRRLVWSEWTHQKEKDVLARLAEEDFLGGLRADGTDMTPSPEALLRRQAEEAASQASLDRLRASFQTAGDEVNLLWLAYSLEGVDHLEEMARRSGREVTEFYRAADRRKRHVRRLLAEDRGVKYEEEA